MMPMLAALNVTYLTWLEETHLLIAGTQQKVVGALLPLVATVILVVAGAGLTGPSMNPAHAFSWNYYLQVLQRLVCSYNQTQVPVMPPCFPA